MPTRPGKPDHRSKETRERDKRAAADEHAALARKVATPRTRPARGDRRG